jgi:predicted metal-dependent hydrolase
MITPNPMPPELERKLYYDGITLFNEHEFFEAHEVWEDIWHMAYGRKHYFYQGLIQCSVALEHYRRSNPRGVLSLYKSYQTKFIDVPDVFMGLDVKRFLGEMRQALAPVIDASPLPNAGEIELDASRAPRIALLYDPFETGEAARYNGPEKP